MAATAVTSKKKQNLSMASPRKIGQVAVGCVSKHGLAKPISFTSVLGILDRAKLVDVIRYRNLIKFALNRAVCKGRIEKVAEDIYQANQEVKEAALQAINVLDCGGCTYDQIFACCHSFEDHLIPDPDELKTFLKIAVDVHLLELTADKKYKPYVRKATKRKRNSE